MSSGWNLNLTKGRGRGRGRGHEVTPSNLGSDPGNARYNQRTSNNYDTNQRSTNSIADRSAERFQKASSPIYKSVQHHLSQQRREEDFESSSDEDDEDNVDDDSIIQEMYKSYSLRIGSGMDMDVSQTQQNIQEALSGGNSCAICIEKIRHTDSVWSCRECSTILHLHCIQNWAKQAIMLKDYKSEEAISQDDATWPCPNCRFEYKGYETPSRYTCFCSKKINPPVHPWLAPHSCGERCDKQLKPECGHVCLLLCHPGPCPPCPQTVKTTCYCGSKPSQLRRCCSQAWSCGSKCNKPLTCGQHFCSTPCHGGDCAPCPKTSQQSCNCGKNVQIRPCASPRWTCDDPCKKVYSCQEHTCERICHGGQCGTCPRSEQRTCPCGKTEFELPCTEEVPTCGDTCEKLLQCQAHKCTRACHNGPCEKCLQMSTKRCRCGLREKSLPCTKEYLCDTRCNKIKPCTRHPCKRRCCDGNCPPCEQTCSKPLTCKNDKCPLPCHPGPCYLCPKTVDIMCFCKNTKITVPCGVERVTKPPKCREPCRIPPDCHHTVRDHHRCHFKRCPPCRQICDKKYPDCSHNCPVRCHSAILTRKMEKVKARSGPWEPSPKPYLEVIEKPCPPCEVPVPVVCLGKHKIWDFPCWEAKPFSCEAVCRRNLSCTNHVCQLSCHTVTNATSEHQAGKECQDCEEPCTKPRPGGCTHVCSLPCHPGDCPPCHKSLKVRCHCKNLLLIVDCSKWTSASENERDIISSCKGPCRHTLGCGHLCSKSCHSGKCTTIEDCRQKKGVVCPCKRKKKNFFCSDITSGKAKLLCDELCQQVKDEKKKKQKEAERMAAEEREKQKQRDQEEYERLMRGKKHKTRKVREAKREKTFLEKHWKNVAIVVGVVATILGLISIALYA
ncbi:NF-X1-type zinc finger protein NFXL1-like [Apostichopus japonicus]|uniref:NF-X1-type zinc finger protein NFXL1-like n=1 Tax=Stichopus japonicus TaxID=307972 RepID=UPI003AB468BA